MKPLDLTVLVHEGPQARAYLVGLRRQGLRPRRIVLLVRERHRGTGKVWARGWPQWLRRPLLERLQDSAENYWPRTFLRQHSSEVAQVCTALDPVVGRTREFVEEMYSGFRYRDYGASFERVICDGWRDERLHEVMRESGPVLFTGGGIVPREFLELPGVTVLHVHPGNLPHVRGADGLLWSTLVRGRPGFSCFRMEPGIDTGPILCAEDYPPLQIPIVASSDQSDRLYQLLFSFVDPLLRAHFFTTRIAPGGVGEEREAQLQSEDDGVTFHFLHPRLRNVALARIFTGADSEAETLPTAPVVAGSFERPVA